MGPAEEGIVGMSELIPIESSTKTIQGCFTSCLYEVPNFQRPYSWESAQLTDYWDDFVLAQSDFFFGATVTWTSVKRDLFFNTYSLIDGQQRLTTSAIALSVMRDMLKNSKIIPAILGRNSWKLVKVK